MSIFKNFNIWWGWQLRKQEGLGAFIFFITTLAAIVGAAFFIASFLPLETYFYVKIRIITGILTPILFYLFINGFVWSRQGKNYKIAINRATEFAKKNTQCFTKITLLKDETERTKDPKIINEWVEAYEKLQGMKIVLRQLKEDEKELPKRILKLTCQIEVLDNKLFS